MAMSGQVSEPSSSVACSKAMNAYKPPSVTMNTRNAAARIVGSLRTRWAIAVATMPITANAA
jgi:hypothetical protein